ncbi:putative ribonuclease H-like domain-containing protein [Tanacetum coccineum]
MVGCVVRRTKLLLKRIVALKDQEMFYSVWDTSSMSLKEDNRRNMRLQRSIQFGTYNLLTNSMNYEPVTAGNQTNRNAGIKDNVDTKEGYATSTNRVSTTSPSVSAVGQSFDNADDLPNDPLMPDLEDIADLLNTRKHAIGTKWVYRNKKDERGIVVRNKARLVAQSYTQEEGINYDKVFAPIARIEAIMLFLAYASFMGFIVYQMDVKSAFLYGTIEEEVAWYETLSTCLLENGFRRGTIDKTLFIKKDKGDILLVQVYADDIIFRSTKKSLCVEFEQMMHKRIQMSSMGELTFFLGLQLKQKDDGIFLSQDKFQVTPKVSHLHAVKRIFRYLKVVNSTTKAEYVTAANCCGQSRMDGRTCNIKQKCVKSQTPRQAKRGQDTKIPQSGGPPKKVGDEAVHKELGDRMERAATTASSLEAEQDSDAQTRIGVDTAKHKLNTARIKQETEVPQLSSPPDTNVADEDASTSVDVRHRWAATTVTSLDAGHGSGNINKTPSMPHDSPLLRCHTLGSGEGIMQQHELIDLVTKLSDRHEALETDLRQTKKVYGDAFTRLIKKDSSKQGRIIEEIDQDARVTLVTPTHSQEDQPEDQLGVFSAAKVLADAATNVHTYTKRRRAVSTGSGRVSTGSGRVSTVSRSFSTAEESVSTAGASMPVSTAGTV